MKSKKAKKKKAPGKAPKAKRTGNGNLKPPWKKGQSGNLKGKPRGRHLSTILREVMKEPTKKKGVTLDRAFIKAGVYQGMKGNAGIFKEIWNRMEGKVVQGISDPDGRPLGSVGADQLRAIAQAFLAAEKMDDDQ